MGARERAGGRVSRSRTLSCSPLPSHRTLVSGCRARTIVPVVLALGRVFDPDVARTELELGGELLEHRRGAADGDGGLHRLLLQVDRRDEELRARVDVVEELLHLFGAHALDRHLVQEPVSLQLARDVADAGADGEEDGLHVLVLVPHTLVLALRVVDPLRGGRSARASERTARER